MRKEYHLRKPLEGRDVRDFGADASRDGYSPLAVAPEHERAQRQDRGDRQADSGRQEVRELVAGVPVEDDRGDIAFFFAVLRDLTIYDMAATIRDIAERGSHDGSCSRASLSIAQGISVRIAVAGQDFSGRREGGDAAPCPPLQRRPHSEERLLEPRPPGTTTKRGITA